MPITLTITGENAEEVVREILSLVDFENHDRARVRSTVPATATPAAAEPVAATETAPQAVVTEETSPAAGPFRQFGKAPEGKSRRTKEEIAEDDAVAALAEKAGVPTEKLEAAIADRGHAAVMAEIQNHLDAQGGQPNISASPEDRRNPDDPQDAADEKAEADAGHDGDNVTIDDLREAMNAFVEKKGMPEAQKSGPGIFEGALGKPPAGNEFWKLRRHRGRNSVDHIAEPDRRAARNGRPGNRSGGAGITGRE